MWTFVGNHLATHVRDLPVLVEVHWQTTLEKVWRHRNPGLDFHDEDNDVQHLRLDDDLLALVEDLLRDETWDKALQTLRNDFDRLDRLGQALGKQGSTFDGWVAARLVDRHWAGARIITLETRRHSVCVAGGGSLGRVDPARANQGTLVPTPPARFENTDYGNRWLHDVRMALTSGDAIELAEVMEAEEVDGWLARIKVKQPSLDKHLLPHAFLRRTLTHPLHRAAGLIECLEWVIDKSVWRQLDPSLVQRECTDANLYVWLVESGRVKRPRTKAPPPPPPPPTEEVRQHTPSSALALWLAKGWIELADGADPDAFGQVFDAMLESPKGLVDRLISHPDVEEVFATDDEVDQFLAQW